ncbi:MAG: hypothetical protein LBG82_07765 [Clostridiales Family XIII bacterium]|jgi:hypothetical protein|nr:hypothetical protein [Clostridiales Family XIII bacterium]
MQKTISKNTVFCLLVGAMMVYAMQAFNQILATGLRPDSFAVPVVQFIWLVPLAIAVQMFVARRLARKIAFAVSKPRLCAKGAAGMRLPIRIATACLMCLVMALIGTLAFARDNPDPLWLKYLRTLATNLPMALAFQLLVAEPVARAAARLVERCEANIRRQDARRETDKIPSEKGR